MGAAVEEVETSITSEGEGEGALTTSEEQEGAGMEEAAEEEKADGEGAEEGAGDACRAGTAKELVITAGMGNITCYALVLKAMFTDNQSIDSLVVYI